MPVGCATLVEFQLSFRQPYITEMVTYRSVDDDYDDADTKRVNA